MKKIIASRKLASLLINANTFTLSKLANDESVAIPYSTLFSLQSFYRNIASRIPSSEEIIILNAFANTLKNDPKLIALSSMITSDEIIAKTQSKMMETYAELFPNYKVPCSLMTAANLANEKVKSKSQRSFNGSLTEISMGSDKNLSELRGIMKGNQPFYSNENITLSSIGTKKERTDKLNPKKEYNVAIFYCNDDESGDKLKEFYAKNCSFSKFTAQFADFSELIFKDVIEYSHKISLSLDEVSSAYDSYATAKAQENGGTFEDFSSPEFSKSLREDFDSYPLTYNENLALKTEKVLFTREVMGKYAFALIGDKHSIISTCNMAKKYGIDVCTALKVPKGIKSEIKINSASVLSCNCDIFGMFFYPKLITAVIPKIDAATALNEIKTDKAELGLNDNLYSAKAIVSDCQNPYALAVNTVISPFISAAYGGKNLQNSDFDLALRIALPFKSTDDFGQSYACILGIYRAICELGISVSDMDFTLSGENSVESALKVHSFRENFDFKSDFDEKEFINEISDENQILDFEKVRKIINGNMDLTL